MESREDEAHQAADDLQQEDKAPVETAVLLQPHEIKSASMAPVGLPVLKPGRSPGRTTSWSVHNGLLDVEAQSVAGSSDMSTKLDNDDQVGNPFRFGLRLFADQLGLSLCASPARRSYVSDSMLACFA